MVSNKLFMAFGLVASSALMTIPQSTMAETLTIQGINTNMIFVELIQRLREISHRCNGPENRKNSSYHNVDTQAVHSCWSLNIDEGDEPDIIYTVSIESGVQSVLFECTATKTCETNTEGVVEGLMGSGVIPREETPDIRHGIFSYDSGDGHGLVVFELAQIPYIQLYSKNGHSGSFDF